MHTYMIDCLVFLKYTSSKKWEYALIADQIELSSHIVHCSFWLITPIIQIATEIE
jgi:hypothetical protein